MLSALPRNTGTYMPASGSYASQVRHLYLPFLRRSPSLSQTIRIASRVVQVSNPSRLLSTAATTTTTTSTMSQNPSMTTNQPPSTPTLSGIDAGSTYASNLPSITSVAALLPLALFAVTGLIGLSAWLDARGKARVPLLQMSPTPFNKAVLGRCPTVFETYEPVPFLTNGHVETILASLSRSRPSVPYRREFLSMQDGGLVTLDWEHFSSPEEDLPPDAPVLILLPGLTGGSGCSYVLHAVRCAYKSGIRAVVFNSRGTADSPVITPQFYSASFTGDMREVVKYVHQLKPNSVLLAAGWSLGANIMMRYLGEEGDETPIKAAVSMCNPFDLTISNANFVKGFNKIYDQNLASGLKKIFEKHDKVWRGHKGPALPDMVPLAKTVRDFDDAITIHTFGWKSVDAYYAGSSSSLSVPHIKIPILCVQALDDPIAPEEAIPYAALEANSNCVLVCTPTGGHLGWVSGPDGWRGEPWTDKVVIEWFESVLLEMQSDRGVLQSADDNSEVDMRLRPSAVPVGAQV